MAKIAILTPDPVDEAFRSRWREVFAELAEPLRERGLEVEGLAWTETRSLARFELVLPLLVWGYHRAGQRWAAQTAHWEREGARVLNPPPVLRWNADKRYLKRLAEQGAPVVRTVYIDGLTPDGLLAAAERFGTDRLIAKPQVSASAWQTIRWSPGQSLDGGPEGAAMIQPYLPSIESKGEVSLIYFGGAFSHAIRKVPRAGDFRVQPEYQAAITAYVPTAEERTAADASLAAADARLLYARVDLVQGLDGKPALMELELVEPDLYLGLSPGAPARLAQAVEAALEGFDLGFSRPSQYSAPVFDSDDPGRTVRGEA